MVNRARAPFFAGNITLADSGTVVGYDAYHFPGLGQLHELCRMYSLLIGVVEHHAVDAPENVLKVKAQVRVGFEPSLKVRGQVCLSDYLAAGVSNNCAATGEISSIASS